MTLIYTPEKIESKLYYIFLKSAILRSPADKFFLDNLVTSIHLKKNESLKKHIKIEKWLKNSTIDAETLKNIDKYYETFSSHVMNDIDLLNLILNPDEKWLFEYNLKNHKYITIPYNNNPVWKIYSNSNSPKSSKSYTSDDSGNISPQSPISKSPQKDLIDKKKINHQRSRSAEMTSKYGKLPVITVKSKNTHKISDYFFNFFSKKPSICESTSSFSPIPPMIKKKTSSLSNLFSHPTNLENINTNED